MVLYITLEETISCRGKMQGDTDTGGAASHGRKIQFIRTGKWIFQSRNIYFSKFVQSRNSVVTSKDTARSFLSPPGSKACQTSVYFPAHPSFFQTPVRTSLFVAHIEQYLSYAGGVFKAGKEARNPGASILGVPSVFEIMSTLPSRSPCW